MTLEGVGMKMIIRFTECGKCSKITTCVSVEGESGAQAITCRSCDPGLYEIAAKEEKEAWLRGDLRQQSR
jgi:hypothetical protein